MIKIRNKRISMMLILAMLVSMFVSVGTASAATNFTDVNYVTYGWVDADSGQTTGHFQVIDAAKFTAAYGADAIDTVKVTVDLPDGVSYSDTGNSTVTEVFTAAPFTNGSLNEEIGDYTVDIESSVTGSIYATVTVKGYEAGAKVFEEASESVLIAKVNTGTISATAKSAKSVIIGDEQIGSDITVKETSPGAWKDASNTIKYSIVTPGVEWESEAYLDGQFTVTGDDGTGADIDRDTDKVLYAEVNSQLASYGSTKVIFRPVFVVSPGTTGDISVKVSGDNIDAATFVVAKIGTNGVAVTVTKGDKDFVYRGQAATFDDVTVKLNPGTDWDEDDYFSVTLPDGVKFINDDYISNPITASFDAGDVEFEGLKNNDKTAWFTVTDIIDDSDNEYATLKLTDFIVVADAKAIVGDLNITFAGAVEGSYKIGSVKNAFTVATTPFAVQTNKASINAANIVITETEDGALKINDDEKYYNNSNDDFLNIDLPAGVTFASEPNVEVTSGDLELGDVTLVDSDTLRIQIDEQSVSKSTITISNLVYNTLNQPSLGDVVARVGSEYNVASNYSLESLTLGTVAVNPTSVYVIGATSFTVNGVVTAGVAPSYIKNSRTYLAIRDIATGLGIDPMNVMWDAASEKVTLVKGDKIVQLTIGSKTMLINGVAVPMDVAPEYGTNDRSFLPAAFIAQAFGAMASWDGTTSTVTIK